MGEGRLIVVIPDGNESEEIVVKIKRSNYWEARCNYNSERHSHVNVRVGNEKFAFLYPEGNTMRDPAIALSPYFDNLIEQTGMAGYEKGMSDVELAACARELAKYYSSILRNSSYYHGKTQRLDGTKVYRPDLGGLNWTKR